VFFALFGFVLCTPMLSVSQDCTFVIAPLVFSNINIFHSSTNNVNKGGKHCLHAEIRILNIRSCFILFIKLSSTRSIFTLQNRPIVCCIYGEWRSDWMVFAVFMGCDILIGWYLLYLWGDRIFKILISACKQCLPPLFTLFVLDCLVMFITYCVVFNLIKIRSTYLVPIYYRFFFWAIKNVQSWETDNIGVHKTKPNKAKNTTQSN
jgi:hypothetical protein